MITEEATTPAVRDILAETQSRDAIRNGSTLLAALDRLRADTKRSRNIRLNKKILLDWMSTMSS